MAAQFDRREFLLASSAAGAAILLGPRPTRAADANGKLRVAAIGTGGKGQSDLEEVAASDCVEVAALCDVDKSHMGWAAIKYPHAEAFADYRRLLDKPNLFDAVLVATPDHMHAPIALAAMQLGKHVHCQKPLTHTVSEARAMRTAAERHKVVTQMGNQIQSHHAYRNAVRLVHDGAIGKVREVHSWLSGAMDWLLVDGRPPGADPVPQSLDWDLWLGVAPPRPFKRDTYHPFKWRAWQDFGSGQLGDFGCHILDPVFMALDLTAPISLEAEAPPLKDEVWTSRCTVKYQFPGTERTKGNVLPLTWYDGKGHKPDCASFGLPAKYELPDAGSVLVGEAGMLVIPHVADAKLFPEDKFKDYDLPKLGDVNHYTSWVDACLDSGKTTSNFTYAGSLSETVLLGVLATRFPGEQLLWDARTARFTQHESANARLSKEYRPGWTE
ncbi:MAG: Gfo/Idh/MocA family oxidoreductase [Pirellulales bacterium]